MNTNNKYFYCYNPNLMQYLKFQKGFRFVTRALHPETLSIFWLFEQSHELREGIKEYINLYSPKV